MNKSGYKHTSLGWIPEDWEVNHIGNLIQKLTSGVSVNGGDYPAGPNEYGVLKVSSVSYGFFDEKENKTILKKDLSRARQNPLAGTIIVSRANTPELVGASAYIFKTNPRLFLSDKLWQLETKSEISDSLWLSYILSLKPIRDGIRDRATGSSKSMRNISQEAFFSIEIPLPPLPEQRRIASTLSTWDAAIAKEQQLIEVLQTRHRALMQQLLSGKKRLKGFKEKWKEVRLGEVFAERNEAGYSDLPLLSITADRGVIYQSENDKKDTSNEDKSKYKRICIGDIGYNTMRMWQGRSALSGLTGIVSPAYTIVTPNNDQCAAFYAALFKTSFMVNRFFCYSQGLVDDTLNCKYKDFAIVKAKVPPLPEQTAIAAILSTSEKEIQTHRRHLATLQQQKKGLMQVLLTGKVRVKTVSAD